MNFYGFKKIIGLIAQPFPLLLSILLCGVLLSVWLKKSWGLYLISCSFIGLYLLSTYPLTQQLVHYLEQQYPAHSTTVEHQNIRYIIVLGCGHVTHPDLPLSSQLSGCAMSRLQEGIRLSRLYPQAQLVFTGSRHLDRYSHAEVMQNHAIFYGVNSQRILIESRPKDTHQEALYLADLIQQHPSLLVTSALHMPRAMGYFQRYTPQITAAPTDYLIRHQRFNSFWGKVPNIIFMIWVYKAFHEYYGLIWQWFIFEKQAEDYA